MRPRRTTTRALPLALLALTLSACSIVRTVEGPRGRDHAVEGYAVWYGKRYHGRRTASGERFNMHAMTAAHRTLPFGAKVRVTDVKTGKSVVVRINDRGPFGDSERIIDLSRGAAERLGTRRRGIAHVKLKVLSYR